MLHVKDAKTDALVRELADRRGISITEAIHQAVREALAKDLRARSFLWDRTAYLRERMALWESIEQHATGPSLGE